MAQVQFKRWADAERAMHSVNGTTPLDSGKGRPLVCHFANPRRAAAGSQTSESAIAPRKLFVGQVRLACVYSATYDLAFRWHSIPSRQLQETGGGVRALGQRACKRLPCLV